MKKILFVTIIIALILISFGCDGPAAENKFKVIEGNSICKDDSKPIIRMYSTSWCPHCTWVAPAFDEVAAEYVSQGKITAYHWELDTNDDKLTSAKETATPNSELAIFSEFSPKGSIPVFVFGCKYYRIGAQFEIQNDLNSEKKEFERIIEELLK